MTEGARLLVSPLRVVDVRLECDGIISYFIFVLVVWNCSSPTLNFVLVTSMVENFRNQNVASSYASIHTTQAHLPMFKSLDSNAQQKK